MSKGIKTEYRNECLSTQGDEQHTSYSSATVKKHASVYSALLVSLRLTALTYPKRTQSFLMVWKTASASFCIRWKWLHEQTPGQSAGDPFNNNLYLPLPVSSLLGEKNEVSEVLWTDKWSLNGPGFLITLRRCKFHTYIHTCCVHMCIFV